MNRYYYSNIDELPLFNWVRINEGKLEYTRINIDLGLENSDKIFHEKISDSNYKAFGIDGRFLRVLETQLLLAEAKLDWIISDDEFLKNSIAMYEDELKELLSSDVGNVDITDTLIIVSKWLGYRVDWKLTTVKEFFKMIENIKKKK